jgi:mono/diheme cytochrome c family protein
LKVDADALPKELVAKIKANKIDMDDPATTVALLKLDAVVGVKGIFDKGGSLKSVGLRCAVCHSTVDDSFAPGIGKRRDGWANRDLNVGAIVSLAPNLTPFTDLLGVDEATLKKVLASWGPGRFDAEIDKDGKAMRPDGSQAGTLIPPAFGLAGVNLHTWTGFGSVPYWNAYVAATEMHGSAPKPPKGSFNEAAAARGKEIFEGKGKCATCHIPPLFTEPGNNLHAPDEVGVDAFQADRSPTHKYRTAPLAGLWAHQKGGFYHDGRFAALGDVVDHYDAHLHLDLTQQEKSELIEYLKSL